MLSAERAPKRSQKRFWKPDQNNLLWCSASAAMTKMVDPSRLVLEVQREQLRHASLELRAVFDGRLSRQECVCGRDSSFLIMRRDLRLSAPENAQNTTSAYYASFLELKLVGNQPARRPVSGENSPKWGCI